MSLENLDDLQASWDLWMIERNTQGKLTQGGTWRKDNPGEWGKLKAYYDGDSPRPALTSITGKQMVEVVDALIEAKGAVVPPPPLPVAAITQTITQGETLTGMADWVAVYDGNADSSPDDPGSVAFVLDGAVVRTENDPPFGDPPWLDTTTLANGNHTFQVRAIDPGGAVIVASSVVTASVANVVTPVPPPSGKPLFDGRAAPVTAMQGHPYGSTGGEYMTPAVWGELAFYEEDINAVADPRFGRVYRIRLNAKSRNPWWSGQPSDVPSCEVTFRRPIQIGQIDWYAMSTKFQAGWEAKSWGVVAQLGYPTLTSPPIAVAISVKNSVTQLGIDRHAGIVTTVGSNAGLVNEEPRFHNLSDVTGKWVDWLIGVMWEVNNTGWVKVSTRVEGGAWAMKFEKANTPTWQQQSGQPPKTSAMDKMGAYQNASGMSSGWENVLLNNGLSRWADEASAKASLG